MPIDVTVCVPTFQGEEHLEDCLASIVDQDLEGVEVLVTDDRSDDATLAIVEAHRDQIPDLRVVVNDRRLGAVGNVNRGFELARGTWIKPVFQDDLLAPECLTTMRSARRTGIPAVVCARSYRYEVGVPDWRREVFERLLAGSLDRRFGAGVIAGDEVAELVAALVRDGLARFNPVGEPVALLLERAAVLEAGGFDDRYLQVWDFELVLRLAVRDGLVSTGRQPLATFRVHEDSATNRNLATATPADALDALCLTAAYATDPAYSAVRELGARCRPPLDAVARAEAEAAEVRQALDAVAPGPGLEDAESRWVEATSRLEAAGASARPASGEVVQSGASTPPGLLGPLPVRTYSVARVVGAVHPARWWGPLIGPLAAMAALQLGWREVPPDEGLLRAVVLFASAIVVVAYSYLVDDAFDVERDRTMGKPNAMARLGPGGRVAVISALAVLGVVPWLGMALSGAARGILAGLVLLPILRSARPFRWKEQPVLGLLADAGNALVLPALFTIALIAPLGPPSGTEALMLAGALMWGVGTGVRSSLIRQVDALVYDRMTGTRSFVTEHGRDRAQGLARHVAFPVEVVGALLLSATVASWSWPAVVVLGFAAGAAVMVRRTGRARLAPAAPVERGGFLTWYQFGPALILSAALAARDPGYVLLVLLVIGGSWPRVRSAVRSVRQAT